MSDAQQAAKGPTEIHHCIYCHKVISGVHQGEGVGADGKQVFSCSECWQSNFIKQLYRDVNAAEAELNAISSAIGTTRFMDPPDGGSVTLAEQVRRMREENAELRGLLHKAMNTGIFPMGVLDELRAALSARSLEVE